MASAPVLLSKGKPWADYCDSEVPLKAAIQKFIKSK